MKAVILAAGYATRLWPLTKNKPKAMLEVGGKPIIEHILAGIGVIPGLKEVFVVTNSKFFHDFEDWAKTFSSGLSVKVIDDMTSSNEGRKGAVGDMHYCITEEKIDDDLLVIAGDNLFEYSLAEFVEYFMRKKTSVVACRETGSKDEVKGKFGVVELDSSSRIVSFEEKPQEPKTSIAATACYLFTRGDVKEISGFIEAGNSPDNAGEFIRWLSRHKPVHAFLFTEKWFDIGTFESLGKAREEFNGKR